MLPERCPNCGLRETLRRETLDWGTPVAIERTYCTSCEWSSGWNGRTLLRPDALLGDLLLP